MLALSVGAPRACLRALLIIGLLGVAMAAFAASGVDASRRAGGSNAAAIKKATMRDCYKYDIRRYCRWQRGSARISTANSRYARGVASGDHSSERFLKRSSRRSRKWRVIARIGGGIPACSGMRRAMPRSVVRDFRIRGWEPGESSDVPCW